ncbi:hypothetical protein JOF56_003591 [Kibdelosporangium banguiense]|uniref:Uncharacterized protein n=1 Tax=Kibdelosporangium banguiense TaxID=1365924 RepID=A0ABS4TFL4_9PSEU|nr:hypothetical protein [Kibdelosporangium banguiense]MBP2323206.1 hypothetical protein [Kibdelosporangium banguiense]
MNTEELRAALHGATAELETAPDFAGKVVRGGARRVRRRRLVVAGVAAATALAVGGTAVFGWQSLSEPAQVATDPRLDQPTRGDLAKDTAFLSEAVQVWEKAMPDLVRNGVPAPRRVTGRPHVYWAGNTPAGRAAIVMQSAQDFALPGRETIRVLIGIDVRTGMLGMLATYSQPVEGPGNDHAFRFGPGLRTVLAIEQDQPLSLSAKADYDKSPKRTWQPMAPADGVVLAQLPDGIGAEDPAVAVGDPGQVNFPENVVLFIVVDDGSTAISPRRPRRGLPWNNPGESHMMWAGIEPDRWRDKAAAVSRFNAAVRISPLMDRATPPSNDSSSWYLTVGLSDGRMAVVSEYQAPNEAQARIYVVTRKSADVSQRGIRGVSLVGPADPTKLLPVLAQLPDNEGWVAAAKDTKLSYRTTVDGPWQGERAESLLAPVGTVQILVQRAGQAPAIVDVK